MRNSGVGLAKLLVRIGGVDSGGSSLGGWFCDCLAEVEA